MSNCRRRGLHGAFYDYVARLYATSETILDVNGTRSVPARVGQGVRQGDPLSSLFFQHVHRCDFGGLSEGRQLRLDGEKISALASVDLLARSKVFSSAMLKAP